MTRSEQIEVKLSWDEAFTCEIAGARRRALVQVLREKKSPTLRDLLALIGEGMCDLEHTPTAGQVRLGDLVGRDGTGPYVTHLLEQLGLGHGDPLTVAKRRKLPELDQALADLLD